MNNLPFFQITLSISRIDINIIFNLYISHSIVSPLKIVMNDSIYCKNLIYFRTPILTTYEYVIRFNAFISHLF
jgi:hypothetical protein